MSSRPNIVYILADDLGYGDVACLNPRGKIPTPNIDRLASEGMVFTDAHSTSSICSPSRYGILTGRYNWRTSLQSGIVDPYGPPLIAENRLTVGELLQHHGYHTACAGKWHLGWDWPLKASECFLPEGTQPVPGGATETSRTEWQKAFSQPIANGPITRGFNHYFGVDVPNWPPYAFIENDRTIGIPSEYLPPQDVVHCVRASHQGPAVEGWRLEDILPALGDSVCDTIHEQAAADRPFFIYMALTSPHAPLAVNDEWKGKSGLNLYADFVMETDAVVGRVLDALSQTAVADETLVIFTSDNGCAPQSGVPKMEALGHFPSAQYRGYKCDIWDGGHRMPFVARWPGVVEPGSVSNQTISLADLMATCAEIVGAEFPDDAGEDSFSILPLLRGHDTPVRENVINHSGPGKFAIRKGKWKLVLCAGSGGWTSPTDEEALDLELPSVQLYDMNDDPGEQINLTERPDKVRELAHLLERLVADGRSTPGTVQSNDVAVDIWQGAEATT
jgi:arylsulfatase A